MIDPAAWIAAVKPIETGIASASNAPAPGSDAASLEGASRGVISPHPLYAFPDPISAHLAAARAGARISLPKVARWVAQAGSTALHDTARHQWLLIETAGGAFSPVTNRQVNADLAVALGPAIWVLVAPDSLGVLHDLRATLTALNAAHRAPDFVVLSSARPPDASTGTNATELLRLGMPRPIAVIPRDGDAVSALAPLARALIRRAKTDAKPARRARSARARA
jgi:dethiobiotin synthetase